MWATPVTILVVEDSLNSAKTTSENNQRACFLDQPLFRLRFSNTIIPCVERNRAVSEITSAKCDTKWNVECKKIQPSPFVQNITLGFMHEKSLGMQIHYLSESHILL